MMALAPDYGRRIRLRRQALGMSQAQLGERVGASESAVLSWEKHRHEPTRKQGAIEAVLGISLSEPPEEPDLLLERVRALQLDPDDEAEFLAAIRIVRKQQTGTRRAG